MKRILTAVLACTVVLSFNGCNTATIDNMYYGKYTFINGSSYDVNFEFYASFYDGRVINKKFTILRNSNHILYSEIRNYPPVWFDCMPDDYFYTVVSNGTVKVIQRPNDGFYNLNNYNIIVDIPYKEEYEYIITDDFFQDGLPIQEE